MRSTETFDAMEKSISRRDFLKKSVAAGAAAAAVGACAKRPETPVEAGEMTYRKCGEDNVSLLGYGCMRWPFTKDSEGNEVVDQEKVNELVDHAIENGVNYFDTAPVYCRGFSETATGIALRRHPRDSYFIATKMSAYGRDLGDRQYEASIEMYHNSFKALGVDTIDYYLLHSVGGGGMERLHKRLLDIGLLDFFLAEREAGRIRHLGFSFHGDQAVFDYLLSIHDQVHWDFVQIQMNYADWRHASGRNVDAEYLYGELQKRGIPAVIMEPLLGGRLANLPDPLLSRLKTLRPDDSAASWSFRFLGSYPGVMCCLSGMVYMEHLRDNLKTFSPLVPINDNERAMLEEIATILLEYPQVNCTNCQYCMPCPYGVDIPGIFAHYNKCITEGAVATDSQSPSYRKARRAFLIGYDRSVPRLRQAAHCIGCKQCLPHCPQSIQIPKELRRIDRYVEKLKRGTL